MMQSFRLLFIFLFVQSSLAFVSPVNSFKGSKAIKSAQNTQFHRAMEVRGGSSLAAIPQTVATFVTSNLQSGPLSIISLMAIASTVLLPITQIKTLYGISIGYGGSVAALAYAVRSQFTMEPLSDALTSACIFYGVRLAGYLALRESKRPLQSKESSRLQRVPFAVSLSLFYSMMMTPVLYVARHVAESRVAWAGVGLAWLGAVMEAVADSQKFILKQNLDESQKEDNMFRGPTSGLYALTRHPNYTGEVLFWTGVLISGIPFLGSSIAGWVSSVVGWFGIVSIMRSATKKLEEKHEEKYGEQSEYKSWTSRVKGPLWPFVKAV